METIGSIVAAVILLTIVMQVSFVWIYGRVMKRGWLRVAASTGRNMLPPTQKPVGSWQPCLAEQGGPLHTNNEAQLTMAGVPWESTKGDAPALEEVAVVLCLRGADPSLPQCLQGIAKQRRQPFQLHIVVDDENDPAVEIVHRYLLTAAGSQPFPYQIHRLSQIPQRCSLKCAALLMAINEIPDHIDKIAFLDADIVPDKNWLHDLIHPFSTAAIANRECSSSTNSGPENSSAEMKTFGWTLSNQPMGPIGATTGNRWFAPATPSLGGYLRQVWNAAAVVQMALYNVAWGGSFALNRKTFHDASLSQRWATAFCEDTMLAGHLKKKGIRLFRVPELVIVNQEATGIRDACRWIVRQLLTVRLYHQGWPLVALHGLSTGVVSLVAPLVAVACWLSSFSFLAVTIATLWLLYQAVNGCLLRHIGAWNQQLIAARGAVKTNRVADTTAIEVDDEIDQHFPSMPAAPVTYVVAILLAQWVQPIACMVAMFSRRVRWRGIEYKIGSDKDIQLIRYRPMSEIVDKSSAKINNSPNKSAATGHRSIT